MNVTFEAKPIVPVVSPRAKDVRQMDPHKSQVDGREISLLFLVLSSILFLLLFNEKQIFPALLCAGFASTFVGSYFFQMMGYRTAGGFLLICFSNVGFAFLGMLLGETTSIHILQLILICAPFLVLERKDAALRMVSVLLPIFAMAILLYFSSAFSSGSPEAERPLHENQILFGATATTLFLEIALLIRQYFKIHRKLALVEDELEDVKNRRHTLSRQVMTTARYAGMAEVVAGILHNIGNVLNSLGTSLSVIQKELRETKVDGIQKLAKTFSDEASINDLLNSPEKRNAHITYLEALEKNLSHQKTIIKKEIIELKENISHIQRLVSTQQDVARPIGHREDTNLNEVIKECLKLLHNGLKRKHITVKQELADIPYISIDRHKVLQILINLMSNARDSIEEFSPEGGTIVIGTTHPKPDEFKIFIRDSGKGISEEVKKKLFSFGFTTKKEGHGFGLHSSALAAQEINGEIDCQSDGVGKGATFTLTLFQMKGQDNGVQ